MTKRNLKVLVVGKSSLLGSGVCSLLERETDLYVVGDNSVDEGGLAAAFDDFRPDVVLVVATSRPISPAHLLAMPTGRSTLRVVVMSPEREVAEMYDRQEVPLTGAANLLAVIRQGEWVAQA